MSSGAAEPAIQHRTSLFDQSLLAHSIAITMDRFITREEFETLRDIVMNLNTQATRLAELMSSRFVEQQQQVPDCPNLDESNADDREQPESETELSLESRSLSSSPDAPNDPRSTLLLRIDARIYDTSEDTHVLILENTFEFQPSTNEILSLVRHESDADDQTGSLPAGNGAQRSTLATSSLLVSSDPAETTAGPNYSSQTQKQEQTDRNDSLISRSDANELRTGSSSADRVRSCQYASIQLVQPTADGEAQLSQSALAQQQQQLPASPSAEASEPSLGLQDLQSLHHQGVAFQASQSQLSSAQQLGSLSTGLLSQSGNSRRVRFNLINENNQEQVVCAQADATVQTEILLATDASSEAQSTSNANRDTTIDDIVMFGSSSDREYIFYANNIYAVPHNSPDGRLDVTVQAWGPHGQYPWRSLFTRVTTGLQLHDAVRDQFGIPPTQHHMHLALVQYRMILPDHRSLWNYGIRNFSHYVTRLPVHLREGDTLACLFIGRGPSANGDPEEAHELSNWRSRRAWSSRGD